MNKIDTFRSQISKHSHYHPLMIGEWSGTMGFGKKQNISQDFISYEIQAYNSALGWYYWNFKVPSSDYTVWSLRDLADLGFNLGFNDPPPSVFY